MSTPGAVLRARIMTYPAALVASLLGPSPNTRIFHLVAPQNVPRPYMVYGKIEGAPEYHLLGEGGLFSATYLLQGFTDTIEQSEALEDIVRNAVSGFRGLVTVESTVYDVRRMQIVSESESSYFEGGAKPLPRFIFSKELAISVYQSIPTL